MTSSSFHSIKFKDPKAKSIIEERMTTSEGDVEIRRYGKEKLLGKGNSGSVYQVVELESKQLLAVKIVSKTYLKKGQNQQKLLSEIQIHKALRHPHIVQFEHVFEDKDYVYILMEICSNNTLKHLVNEKQNLSEIEVQYYIYQMIEALQFLHSRGIIHRDLKLRNIFLNDEMKIKIGDFGLAIKVNPSDERRKTICGSPNFVAPEVLNQSGYSYEADIWSLGVICYTLLVGKMPFDTVDPKDTYKKILKANYTFPQELEISEPAKDFVSKILVLDPSKRLSLEEMLDHPFLNTKGKISRQMPTPIQNTGSSTTFLETLARSRQATQIAQNPPEVPVERVTRRSKTTVGPLKLTVFRKRLPSLVSKTGIETLRSAVRSADEPYDVQKSTPSTQASHTGSKSSLPTINEIAPPAKRAKLVTEVANAEEDVTIVNWLEYPKHGFGYLLSNSAVGVLFNDSTKIILNPPFMTFDYIVKTFVEKKEVRTTHGLIDFPKELSKKVSVLQRFRDYFKGKEFNVNDIVLPGIEIKRKATQTISKKKIEKSPVFIKKWIKTQQAMIFRLTTQVWQIIFKDKTTLVINPIKQLVTFNDPEDEKMTWSLEDVVDCGNEDVIKRLTYAQEIIKKARKLEKDIK